MNIDSFKVFDSFNEFVKPISNETKLSQNLPFVFSVVHNTTVREIFRNTDRCSTADRKMKLLSKSIIRRFEDSRRSFSTVCVFYRIDVPFLSSVRVYFV